MSEIISHQVPEDDVVFQAMNDRKHVKAAAALTGLDMTHVFGDQYHLVPSPQADIKVSDRMKEIRSRGLAAHEAPSIASPSINITMQQRSPSHRLLTCCPKQFSSP